MRKILILLTLLLCLGGLAFSASGGEEEGSGVVAKEKLADRANDLYETIRLKDISIYYIRESLEDFFVSPDSLSEFIVSMLYDLRKARIKDNRIRKFKIKEIELAENDREATIKVKLSGRYFLFFNRSFTREDKWEYQDGKWLLIPPKKLY
jgi:hypothetical protein